MLKPGAVLIVLFSLFCTFGLACSSPVYATSRITTTWEASFVDSDFSGIVECIEAGGIVATYRVVESWKGKVGVGSTLSLRRAVDYWGTQFPVAMCGTRYVVIASKNGSEKIQPNEWNNYYRVPLWWRAIPADYYCSTLDFMLISNNSKINIGGIHEQDVSAFKETATSLASMTLEGQEEAALRSLCDKFISRARGDIFYFHQMRGPEKYEAWRRDAKARIDQAESTTEIVHNLIEIRNTPEADVGDIDSVLSFGGGETTLIILKKLNSNFWDHGIRSIQERLSPHVSSNQSNTMRAFEEPTESELAQFRATIKEGNNSEELTEAINRLTLHDPGPVAGFLRHWRNPKKDWIDVGGGYRLASRFGHYCGTQREKHLLTLLLAIDDEIRVTGAIYLTLEDETLGMKYLEQYLDLPGDPGVRAALNMARRGRKDAMPRALQVFNTKGADDNSGKYHRNLQSRVRILLSNSCKISGIPMPSLAYGTRSLNGGSHEGGLSPNEARLKNLEWWDAHKERIVLHDPWLEILKEQKID